MHQLIEFFLGLFDTNQWPARWHCGHWTNFHGWLYIVSEAMVWLAYFLIPLIILNYLHRKKSEIKFKKVYLLFAAFILLCGSTHFLDAMMFWVPMYRLNALVRFITGIVSLFTVWYLVKLLPVLFSQKTNLELEKEIARREEAEVKLAEANKNLEAFAFVASHDLQEPLRKIGLYAEKLSVTNEKNLDSTGIQTLSKIVNSSARLRTMIDDVLKLSSIRESIKLEEIDLAVPLERAIADLEVKIQEKDAIINIGELPKVRGNAGYLSHLFMNLISNSIKFSNRRPIINITSEQKGNIAALHFEDNGIGMDEQDLEKIFTAFHRLHSKSRYEGSGLGLAISKRIIDVHNGNISVKSEIDEGTTFTIELQQAT